MSFILRSFYAYPDDYVLPGIGRLNQADRARIRVLGTDRLKTTATLSAAALDQQLRAQAHSIAAHIETFLQLVKEAKAAEICASSGGPAGLATSSR